VLRVLVAAFALWLPAATGQGGKATVVAAHTLAKSMNERPHLSCHGDAGSKKNCCCKGKETLRAAACGCHDGETVYGTSAHDPMLAAWVAGAVKASSSGAPIAADAEVSGRSADVPELPPPKAGLFLPA
jgi:hypothetical protein